MKGTFLCYRFPWGEFAPIAVIDAPPKVVLETLQVNHMVCTYKGKPMLPTPNPQAEGYVIGVTNSPHMLKGKSRRFPLKSLGDLPKMSLGRKDRSE